MYDNNNMILANTCACREIRQHLFEGLWNSLYIIMYIYTLNVKPSYTYNMLLCIGLLISSFHYIQSEY